MRLWLFKLYRLIKLCLVNHFCQNIFKTNYIIKNFPIITIKKIYIIGIFVYKFIISRKSIFYYFENDLKITFEFYTIDMI